MRSEGDMAINMTEEQFNRLIQAIRPQEQDERGGAVQRQGTAGAAAVVGQMPGCQLGRNKIKRFKKWNDWLRDAESKMRFLSIAEGSQKVDFLRSCAGGELRVLEQRGESQIRRHSGKSRYGGSCTEKTYVRRGREGNHQSSPKIREQGQDVDGAPADGAG